MAHRYVTYTNLNTLLTRKQKKDWIIRGALWIRIGFYTTATNLRLNSNRVSPIEVHSHLPRDYASNSDQLQIDHASQELATTGSMGSRNTIKVRFHNIDNRGAAKLLPHNFSSNSRNIKLRCIGSLEMKGSTHMGNSQFTSTKRLCIKQWSITDRPC